MPNSNPPIIDAFNAPSTVNEGDTFQVTVVAHDSDSRVVTFSAAVTDSDGQQTTAQTTVTVGDPIAYALTADDPSVTITPTTTPGVFQVTV